MKMFMPTFERNCAAGEHWAIVVLRPGALAASATPDDYATEVAALERVSPAAARTAYSQ